MTRVAWAVIVLFLAGAPTATAQPPLLDVRDPDVFGNDGAVTVSDIGAVVGNFGATCATGMLQPALDLNVDCAITVSDIGHVVATFGQVNWPPKNSPATPIVLAAAKLFQLYVTASDPDNDPITFLQPQGLPPGATFTNPDPPPTDTRRWFQWTPTTPSCYPVTFQVSDGSAPVTQTIYFSVGLTTCPNPDTTPPPAPGQPTEESIDQDYDADGRYTVHWTGVSDPESGIAGYEVEEATSPGGPWTLLSACGGPSTYCNITGRSDGITYYYRIRARNGAGLLSGYSPVSDGVRIDMSPPMAPGIPTEGSPDQDYDSDGSYTVYWLAASDPESGIRWYELQEATAAEGPWTTVSGTISGASRSISGRSHGVTYFYRVRAQNRALAWGPYSSASDGVTVDNTAPTTPTVTDDGTFTTSTTQLHFQWTAATDAESGIAGYEYLIRQDSTSGTIVRNWTATGIVTDFTAMGLSLTLGRKYFIGVRAKNGAGSYSAAAYSDGIDALSATEVTLTAESAGWFAGNYARFRRFGVLLFSGGRGFNVAIIDPTTGIVEQTQSFDTWSSCTNFTPLVNFIANIPSGRIVLVAVRDEAGLTQWDSCTRRSCAEVESGLQVLEELGSAQIRNYCYRDSWAMVSIKGQGVALAEQLVHQTGAGSLPAIVTATVPLGTPSDMTPPTVPGQPTEGSPDQDYDADGTYQVCWTAASDPESGIASYELQERTGPTGLWSVMSSFIPGTSTCYSVSGRQDKTTYFYRVRARNGAGLIGSFSPVSDGVTVDMQGPQTVNPITVTNVTTSSATITWTTNEPAFCWVDYGFTTTYGQSTPRNATPMTAFSVALSGLAEFADYHFEVRCEDQAGNSVPSGDLTFRTTVDAPLGVDQFDAEGIIFGSWWFDEYQTVGADQSLVKLAKTGADYVGVLATWYMDTTPTDGEYSRSNVIYPHLYKSPTDDALIHAIRLAKLLGRKVFLKLHVRVILNNDPFGAWSDRWAGRIQPSNPSAWFTSYRDFAVHYAQLAQAEGVELFAFGTEMPSTTISAYATQWDAVIDAIRANYTGLLTFSANIPTEFQQITFWDRCDYLGVGPYYSLTPSTPVSPGLDAIVDGWRNSPDGGDLIQLFSQWSAQHNKWVLFTEIGHASVDTCTYKPWKGTSTEFGSPLPENHGCQQRAYDALMLVLQNQPWFAGMFWWDWLGRPDAGTVGIERREYTPQNKPAEQSLKNFFQGLNTAQAASITIVDGNGVEIPDGASVRIGGSKNLFVVARDGASTLLGYAPAVWAVTGAGGTLAANQVGYARFNATGEGMVQVTATLNTLSDSVTLSVTSNTLRVPSQYPTIQAAANVAQSGDTILVAPGAYPESVTLPAGVNLLSEQGAGATIIDAAGLAFGLKGGALVEGFTIRNANGPGVARGTGANTTQRIVRNIIENSKKGIDIYGAAVSIVNNVIRNNTTTEYGGGVRIDGNAQVEVINNVIHNNTAAQGGGVYVSSSPLSVVRNNIIIGNSATTTGSGIRVWSSAPAVDYNDVWSNTGSPQYDGISPGAGSLNADPQLANQVAGDYRLRVSSPCVNTGHPDPVYNDRDGSRNDMGLYGGPDAPDGGQLVGPGPSLVRVSGRQLLVQKRNPDGTLQPEAPYVIRGVGWSPASIGTDTWPSDAANAQKRRPEFGTWYLTDISLMKQMNVNTVRTFLDLGVPGDVNPANGQPLVNGRIILDELYRNGIMVIMTVDNANNNTTRAQQVVNYYKDHPAILMWMLGNEWNISCYYLIPSWQCVGPAVVTAAENTQTAAQLVKGLDGNHPVATGYGDIDIAADGKRLADTQTYVNGTCPSVDVWGLNLYRGYTFDTAMGTSIFSQWASISTKPFFISEFGIDAYDYNAGGLNQTTQAEWDRSQWDEIIRNLSATNPLKAALGGTVFEWNDEWWKVSPAGSQQIGGWAPAPFPDGFANEEYFGLVDIDRNQRQVYTTLQTAYTPGYTPGPRVVTMTAMSQGGCLLSAPEVVFSRDWAPFYQGHGCALSGGRGFNVAVIDTAMGSPLEPPQTFDTWYSSASGVGVEHQRLVEYLANIPDGTLVMVAVGDEAGLTYSGVGQCTPIAASWIESTYQALESLGSTQIRNYCYNRSWAMIAIKGGPVMNEVLGPGLFSRVTAEATITLPE